MIWDVKRAAELIELTLIFFEFLQLSWNCVGAFPLWAVFVVGRAVVFFLSPYHFIDYALMTHTTGIFLLLLSCYHHFLFTEKNNDECL